MSLGLFRMASVPDLEDDELTPLPFTPEHITTPGRPSAKQIYDRDLHELVGQLLAHAVKNNERMKKLRSEVRAFRLELRALTRRQTVVIGTAATLVQVALEVWRRVHP